MAVGRVPPVEQPPSHELDSLARFASPGLADPPTAVIHERRLRKA